MSSLLVRSLAAAAAVLAFRVPEDGLAFRPEAGSRAAKEFALTIEFGLGDVEVSINGTPTDPSMLGGLTDGEIAGKAGYRIDCVDTYAAVADGRPRELLRSFGELVTWYEMNGGDSDEDSSDGLDGRTVRFLWDDDEDGYRLSFPDDDGDEEDLEALGEDLDLRALLPAAGVAVGDAWEVSGEALLPVLLPSLDLAKLAADAGAELSNGIPAELLEAARDMLEDAVATCTYGGVEDLDGVRLGRVDFEFDLDGEADLDPESMLDDDATGDVDFGLFRVSLELEFTGRLYWNLAEGRFQLFEMHGLGDAGLAVEASLAQGFEIAGQAVFDLDLTHEASAESD